MVNSGLNNLTRILIIQLGIGGKWGDGCLDPSLVTTAGGGRLFFFYQQLLPEEDDIDEWDIFAWDGLRWEWPNVGGAEGSYWGTCWGSIALIPTMPELAPAENTDCIVKLYPKPQFRGRPLKVHKG